MESLKVFFQNIKFNYETVVNGSIRWVNPHADLPMNRVIHRKFFPLNDTQILELENEVNSIYHTEVVFPQWYKTFLKFCNGFDVFYGAITFCGKQTIDRTNFDNESPYSLYTSNLSKSSKAPKTWLQLGSYGYDKTRICIDTQSGDSKIFCVYNETIKIICEWNSFEDFITEELKRLDCLFNKNPWTVLKSGTFVLPKGHKLNNE